MKYLTVFALILILAAFLSLIFIVPRIVKVESVSCLSQYGPCSEQIEQKIKSFQGKSLWESRKGIGTLVKSEPIVADFLIQFRLPNKLTVNLVEKKAKFALKAQGQNIFALVYKNGTVVRIQDATNLPYLEIKEKIPNVGDVVDKKQLLALDIVFEMFNAYAARSGKIENDYLKVEAPNLPTTRFPLDGDRDVLMGALAVILQRLKGSDKDSKIENADNVRIIDLRFKNPVLQ